MLPFSITESDVFFDFLHDYNIVKNRSEMPSRKAVSTTALTDVCDAFEVKVKKFFQICDPSSIATTYDMWTDGHEHQNCINLSVQFIDKQWKLYVVNLGTDQLERPHTAVRNEEHIEDKLKQFELEDMINISVKENGDNIKACARKMSLSTEWNKTQSDDFECFAHNLHLLVMKDVLKDSRSVELKALIAKVKAIYRTLS